MPYVIVTGNLTPYKSGTPWKVGISGLKGVELEELDRFKLEGQVDPHTVVFKHHPIVLLNALEVLGYRVVSSFSTDKPALNTSQEPSTVSVWTMRREFPEPEPSDDESDSNQPTDASL